MATGPKTGFIEVVRNAKTIAEVSYINCSVVPGWPLPKLPSVQVSETNNNKKLYEWIKSQQIKSVRG